MKPAKLGRETSQHMAILRNQVSTLFWTGRVSTTYARAKATGALAEKYLTLAIASVYVIQFAYSVTNLVKFQMM